MSLIVALDRNGDGFICADAQPGDALNLLPDPLLHAPLGYQGTGLDLAEVLWLETAFGQRVLRATFGDPGASIYPYDTVNDRPDAPIQPSTTYTAAVWLRVRVPGSYTVTFAVLDTSASALASTSVDLSESWTRASLTFTTGAADTHIALSIGISSVSSFLDVDAAGAMLVAGSVLPDGFNTGDARDLNDIITDDVLKVSWRLGVEQPYDAVSTRTQGSLLLDNASGDYLPESGAAAMTPGSLVRVYDESATLDHVLFTGWIDHVEPQSGDLRAPRVSVVLSGPEQVLSQVQALIPLVLDSPPGLALALILDDPALWKFFPQLVDGVNNFPFIGDGWSEGIPALRAIRQIVESESGRFFTDRRGHLNFYAQDHDYGSSQVSFEDDYDDLSYVYGADLVNQVRVSVYPRSYGTPGTVIWKMNSSQLIPAGECRTLIASFRDSSSGRTGAFSVITPVASTDFNANTASDGSGTDVTGDFTVSLDVDHIKASAAILTICNNGAVDAYVLAGMQVRGTPLIQGDRLIVESRDEDSIAHYGPHLLEISLPQLVTIDVALDRADSIVTARAEPAGAIRSITLSHRNRLEDALTYSLFDRITITDTSLDHTDDYLIIAESHAVDGGGARHTVTWTLEPI